MHNEADSLALTVRQGSGMSYSHASEKLPHSWAIQWRCLCQSKLFAFFHRSGRDVRGRRTALRHSIAALAAVVHHVDWNGSIYLRLASDLAEAMYYTPGAFGGLAQPMS